MADILSYNGGRQGSGLGPVIATAEAMNCRCHGGCSGLEAAYCLHSASLHMLQDRRGGEVYLLLQPLSVVLGRQKSREGQQACAAFANALAASDHGAVLDSCRRLIAVTTAERETAGRGLK